MYWLLGLTLLTYAVYLRDREQFKEVTNSMHVGAVHTVFQFIENYSPFMEFLETEEETIERFKKTRKLLLEKIKCLKKSEQIH